MILSWPTLIAAALQAKQPITGLSMLMQNDPVAHTLTAQTSVLDASPFTASGPPANQSLPALHLASVQGNSGQYNDSLTNLDYYGSRYYDQVVGVFLSADVKQGNMQGMNPYAYVGGNPETRNDPTGQMYAPNSGGGGAPLNSIVPTSQPQTSTQPSCGLWCGLTNVASGVVHVVGTVADLATGFSSMVSDVHTLFNGNASVWDKIGAGADLLLNIGLDVSMVLGVGEMLRIGDLALRAGIDIGEHIA